MILVTGAAGFIGSNLVAALDRRGGTGLAVCDRMDHPAKIDNLAGRRLAHQIAPEDIMEFLAAEGTTIEAIFHMGAISSTTETNVALITEMNVELPVKLWIWCREHRVPLIYASSAATYGDGAQGFDDDGSIEHLSGLAPLNAYGRSKNEFDLWVAGQLADGAGAPPQWAGLKFFNVYGPNENHKGAQQSVVPQVYRQIKESGRARLFQSHHPDYEDGGQLRDFIWVGDCVDVMLWLAGHPDVSGLFNCGTGRARSFKDLAAAVFGALGREVAIDYIPTPENIRDKYQYFTEAPMDKLRSAGYTTPFTSLEDGVTRYVQNHLDA